MNERRSKRRGRSLKGGKILFHQGRSAIECTIHDLSEGGACVEVINPVGIPSNFDLLLEGEIITHRCTRRWTAGNRTGVSFDAASHPAAPPNTHASKREPLVPTATQPDQLPHELLQLRSALDHVTVGVVLLDSELRAQFINRAFRNMWKLPDEKADAKPAFVALMYHGRDTRAYDLPDAEVAAYIAERVAQVKSGHRRPMDLRLSNGEVLRFQCTPLPAGGRMLSYTVVTDIVRHADEFEHLRDALDHVVEGVIVLDGELYVRYMNCNVMKLWQLSEQDVARKLHYKDLFHIGRRCGLLSAPPEGEQAYIDRIIALIRINAPIPVDFQARGRTIHGRCAPLSGDGHILTFDDISDLVERSDERHPPATSDAARRDRNELAAE